MPKTLTDPPLKRQTLGSSYSALINTGMLCVLKANPQKSIVKQLELLLYTTLYSFRANKKGVDPKSYHHLWGQKLLVGRSQRRSFLKSSIPATNAPETSYKGWMRLPAGPPATRNFCSERPRVWCCASSSRVQPPGSKWPPLLPASSSDAHRWPAIVLESWKGNPMSRYFYAPSQSSIRNSTSLSPESGINRIL